jgi:hypothetical protein
MKQRRHTPEQVISKVAESERAEKPWTTPQVANRDFFAAFARPPASLTKPRQQGG